MEIIRHGVDLDSVLAEIGNRFTFTLACQVVEIRGSAEESRLENAGRFVSSSLGFAAEICKQSGAVLCCAALYGD